MKTHGGLLVARAASSREADRKDQDMKLNSLFVCGLRSGDLVLRMWQSERGGWEGEASGTFISVGETVAVKYAYAQRGRRFGQKSITVLVTDKPIPKEDLAEEMEYLMKLIKGELKGLKYHRKRHGQGSRRSHQHDVYDVD